jgi:peptide/nickel transport system ATP-binding protein
VRDDCRTGDHPTLVPVSGGDHEAACLYYQAGYDASVVRSPADREADPDAGGETYADGGLVDGHDDPPGEDAGPVRDGGGESR